MLIAETLHLTYCTNIHPADGWSAVQDNLRRYAPALKRRFAPNQSFGIGLRLSAREARELLSAGLDDFRSWLDREGLYIAIINGFPFGPFHGTAVKHEVYAPDWRQPARVAYTADLIAILACLLPERVEGGISTVPLSYKPWMLHADDDDWYQIVRHLVDITATLVRVWQDTGRMIHLDLEPEPGCVLEDSKETVDFFERWLLPQGAPVLAQVFGVTVDRAREYLLEHLRVCFDCCHFAVQFEDPVEARRRLTAAGIRIGRVQLSSALDVHIPADRSSAASVADRLRRFADAIYLHQVVEKRAGSLHHYPDLDHALDALRDGAARHWRIHFHVPLFIPTYDGLGSTRDGVSTVIRAACETGFTHHLEIETYTWAVLPDGLKTDLFESIAREYEWVLDEMRRLERRGTHLS